MAACFCPTMRAEPSQDVLLICCYMISPLTKNAPSAWSRKAFDVSLVAPPSSLGLEGGRVGACCRRWSSRLDPVKSVMAGAGDASRAEDASLV